MKNKLDFSEWPGNAIPAHTQEALKNYVERGYMPGGFLTAVLCNNLSEAAFRADSQNTPVLAEITKYVVWNVPPYARCSVEQMEHYCEMVLNPAGR